MIDLQRRGTTDNKLQSAYDGYNSYRGDMENKRKSAEQSYDAGRLNTSRSMTADGVKRDSPQWKQGMATVESEYTTTMDKINSDFEEYKKGDEYSAMQSDYAERVKYDPASMAQDFTEQTFEALKPTFDQYYTATQGTPEQRSMVNGVMRNREIQAINRGAS